MRPNITPDTHYGLVLLDGDQSVYCMFKRDEKHPDSLDSEVLQPMYLTAPQPVPPGYRYEGDDEINEHCIAFVAFNEDPTLDFQEAYNMVMIEVTNENNDPAIEFVREHAEGGTIQQAAHDLFTACFYKMMDEMRGSLN